MRANGASLGLQASSSCSEGDHALLNLRRELYPEIYGSDRDVAQDLERYAVEIPEKPTCRPHVPEYAGLLSQVGDAVEPNGASTPLAPLVDDHNGGDAGNGNSPTPGGIATRQQSYTQIDIWGRIPSKEPKFFLTCSICRRPVAASRFAPHLDKCMGLGVGARANASR